MLIIKSDNIVYGVKYEIHKAELPWGIVDVHCAHNGIFPCTDVEISFSPWKIYEIS